MSQEADTDVDGLIFSERQIQSGLSILQRKCHEISRSKGWWDQPRNFGEMVALIHSEASELLEAERHGNPASEHCPSLSAGAEEMADIVIRVCDMAQSLGVDLGYAVRTKMRFNESRPHKHGGKKF